MEHLIKRLGRLLYEAQCTLDEIRECPPCRPERRYSFSAISGPSGVYSTMLNLKPGQTGTVIFTAQDNTQTPPVTYPLDTAGVPSVDDATKATVSLVNGPDGAPLDGTKGHGDGLVTVLVTQVTGATPGPFNVLCNETDNDSTTFQGVFACSLIGPEDDAFTATGSVNT